EGFHFPPPSCRMSSMELNSHPSTKGASMLKVDTSTRAGRMIEAGRIKVTFRSVATGQHITISAKCRKHTDEGWTSCPLDEAMVIFLEVPNASGGWNDRVGKVTRRNGFV